MFLFTISSAVAAKNCPLIINNDTHHTLDTAGEDTNTMCRARYDPHFRSLNGVPSGDVSAGDVTSAYMFSVDVYCEAPNEGYLGLIYNAVDLDNFDFIYFR